jgi:hypothetical protein
VSLGEFWRVSVSSGEFRLVLVSFDIKKYRDIKKNVVVRMWSCAVVRGRAWSCVVVRGRVGRAYFVPTVQVYVRDPQT